MIVVGNSSLTKWLTFEPFPHALLLILGDVYATFKAFIAPHDQKLMAHS
jgi:hypothetical protein